jgi:hypothetical protein
MLKLLEEREDILIFFDTDSHEVKWVRKNPYTLLKYGKFKGERISYSFSSYAYVGEGGDTEEYVGRLYCYLDGEFIEISYYKVPMNGLFVNNSTAVKHGNKVGRLEGQIHGIDMMAEAILTGNEEQYRRLWKLFHAIAELRAYVITGPDGPMVIGRGADEKLLIHSSLDVTVDEELTYVDGSHVAKMIFEIKDNNRNLFARFRNSNYAVALVGRDEIGQLWMHFVPPDYRDKPILDCELWLVGGRQGDVIITP